MRYSSLPFRTSTFGRNASGSLSWVALGGAAIVLGVGCVFPPAAIILGSAGSCLLIWLARPIYFPALLVLQFTWANFVLEGFGTIDHSAAQFEAGSLVIAGFPVTVSYFVGVSVVARVLWELFSRPKVFRGHFVMPGIAVWVLAMFAGAIMSWLGYLEHNPSWTLPIRTACLAGTVFYGAIVIRAWPVERSRFFDLMLLLAVPLLILAIAGHFFDRILFLYVPLIPPLAISRLRGRGAGWTLVGVVALGSAVLYGLGFARDIYIDDTAGGVLGTSASTFTLNGMLVLSLGLTLLAFLPLGSVRRFCSWFLGWPAIAAMVFATATVIVLVPTHRSSGEVLRENPASLRPIERLQRKIFDDRGRIWEAAWDDAITAPLFFKAAGRPMPMITRFGGYMEWTAGAHNLMLDQLCSNGFFLGSFMLLLAVLSLLAANKVFALTRDGGERALAVAVIATVIVAGVTGHYALSESFTFWFLLSGGVLMAVRNKLCARPVLAVRKSN